SLPPRAARVSSTCDLDTRGGGAVATALGHHCGTILTMLYTARCFWPGGSEDEVRCAATRAGSRTGRRLQATFRGALYLPGDELVLCLFDSSSHACVKRASERAG